MDINSLLNISSPAITEAAKNATVSRVKEGDESFSSLFQSALSNINETNTLLNQQEEEEITFALGITDNTHDLSIAMAKAQTALSYTVALRDKFIESYQQIMQIQV